MSGRSPRVAAALVASPAPRALGNPGTPVLAECSGNDDERERRQRRRSRAVDSSLQGLGSPVARFESWQPPLPQWSHAQISEHYSTCIKLSTENKITTKNAFGLHLIDYMTEILKQKNSDLTNFQVAAGTLDASAKIYAVRVDSVHADTYRVLGGLGKDSAPPKDLESPEEESSPAPAATKKVQPRKKQTFKTIEQNLNNINVSEAGRRCEVDPMFQRAAASFDECSSAGIFLTGLHTQSFQSRLLFAAKIVPLPSSESLTLPSSDPVRVADLKALLAPCLERRWICSSLAGFQFTHWDQETHDESVSALLEKFKRSEQVFDPNAELDSEDSDGCAEFHPDSIPESQFQPDSIPEPQFQPDSPRSTAGEKMGEFTDSVSTFSQRQRTDGAPLVQGDIGTMCLHLSMNPGEYSYFSPRTMAMWAGPKHWRFRPRHRPTTGSEQNSRKKNPRKVFQLDFEEDVDFESHFRKTKASITLAKSTLENQKVRSTTLPADFNYDPQNILQLFLKVKVKLSQSLESLGTGTLDNEAGIEDYDYNNPNDTSNFCPALQVPDSDDDAEPVGFVGQAGEFNLTAHPEEPERNGVCNGDITTYGELNLIAEPQKINKIAIQYAKTAKKMDMRRLKKNMWELLTDGKENETVEEQAEEAGEEKDTAVVEGQKVLSDITKDLLQRLPPTMATNLSVPLAFVCLLHLANEKNLKLESTKDLSDILVEQGH